MANTIKTTLAGNTKSDGYGSRFLASGQLFTISGNDDHTWVVHEAVLSESPVLAKLCQTPMVEAKARLIKIPEDDPSIFGRLLEYLYCGEYSPRNIDSVRFMARLSAADNSSPDREADIFASVYIMADKYQLEKLQELTVSKVKRLHALSDDTYFSMVQKIYDAIPSSDIHFRQYVLDSAAPRLGRLHSSALATMLDKIGAGGILARDYFEAQHKAIEKESRGTLYFGLPKNFGVEDAY